MKTLKDIVRRTCRRCESSFSSERCGVCGAIH